jgi:hypothetical protein
MHSMARNLQCGTKVNCEPIHSKPRFSLKPDVALRRQLRCFDPAAVNARLRVEDDPFAGSASTANLTGENGTARALERIG